MPYTTYLRWGILSGLFFLLFIPFLIANGSFLPNMFFPYITGKNFTFRIIVELIFLCYVLLALKDPQYRPKASYIFYAALAFVAWMGLATILAVDPVKSFWSNFERMEGYVTLLHLFLLFVVAGAALPVRDMWRKFFTTSVVASTLIGAMALFQVLNLFGFAPSSQSGARADATFGNATYLAVYMLVHVFLTLFLLVRDRRSTGMQVFYGLALVLQLSAVYYTQTRGAILGVIGGLIIAGLWMVWRGRGAEWRGLRKASLIGLGIGVVLVLGFLALRNTALIQNSPTLARLASISLEDNTTKSRFIIWGVAYEGFLERPLTGWGQENFNYVFNKRYSPEMYNQEQWFDRAHNQFLDWLVAGGLPAFLLYISLFGLAALAVIRSSALSVPEQAVLLGLLGGYAFNNSFVFDNITSALFFYFLLAFCHGLSMQGLPRFMVFMRPAHDHTVAIAAPIVAVIILGTGWYLNAGGVARAQTLIDAITTTDPATGRQKELSENIDSFRQALSQGPLGKQEAVEQLYQFASQVGAQSNISPDIKQEVFGIAEEGGLAFLEERKNDARLESFTGLFYAQYGEFDNAILHLGRAMELSPEKQTILFQVGEVYLREGRVEEALSVLKRAFDAAPQFDTARLMYVGALYYAGRGGEADALLTERYGTTLVDEDQLLQIYTRLSLHERVIAIWQMRVEKDPQNTDTLLGLASAQFAGGNTAATIATLRKVSQMNPAMASQVNSLISQLESGVLRAE